MFEKRYGEKVVVAGDRHLLHSKTERDSFACNAEVRDDVMLPQECFFGSGFMIRSYCCS